jgi:hypothetical protein
MEKELSFQLKVVIMSAKNEACAELYRNMIIRSQYNVFLDFFPSRIPLNQV